MFKKFWSYLTKIINFLNLINGVKFKKRLVFFISEFMFKLVLVGDSCVGKS